MDELEGDQRLPHHREPKQLVSKRKLAELGVLHWKLDADDYEGDSRLAEICKSRGYSYQDIISVSPKLLPNYEVLFVEALDLLLHLDEEIRFCLDGSGYFDIRDLLDHWVRVWVKKGDLIVLPAGSYHRFTLDDNDYIKGAGLDTVQ